MKKILTIFFIFLYFSCENKNELESNLEFPLNPILEGEWYLHFVSIPFLGSIQFNKDDNIWLFDTKKRLITIKNFYNPIPHGYSILPFQSDKHSYNLNNDTISIFINRINPNYKRVSKFSIRNIDTMYISPINGYTDSESMILIRKN